MRFVPSSCYIFIVDTDTYAGNFEREMTAHCTGHVGDCGVGNSYAEKFQEECPKEYKALGLLIEQQPDEHGNSRPASIYVTPGFWNDGLGTAWPDAAWGTTEAIEKYRESARKCTFKQIDSSAFDEDAMPSRYPSYQSVAMFFHDVVPVELLKFMVERVKTFKCKYGNGPSTILGYRFVHEKIVPQLDVIWSAS